MGQTANAGGTPTPLEWINGCAGTPAGWYPHPVMVGTRTIAIAAALLWLGYSAPALAQSRQFKLEDDTWVESPAPEPGSDEAVIAHARQLLAKGRFKQARALMDDWIGAHGREDNPWLAEALVLRGDARSKGGDEFAALYDYEQAIRDFPGSPAFARAVGRELEIGTAYLHGRKRKFLGLRMNKAFGFGEELLIRVAERMPGSQLAERAQIELADYYYRIREMRQAGEAYELFLVNFPRSKWRMYAQQQRIYANVARFKGPRYDGSGLIEAGFLVQQFKARFPLEASRNGIGDALAARIDESGGAQMLESAQWYLTRHDEVSARFVLQRLVRKHPRTVAASRAIEIMQRHGWFAQVGQSGQVGPEQAPPPAGGDVPNAGDEGSDAGGGP